MTICRYGRNVNMYHICNSINTKIENCSGRCSNGCIHKSIHKNKCGACTIRLRTTNKQNYNYCVLILIFIFHEPQNQENVHAETIANPSPFSLIIPNRFVFFLSLFVCGTFRRHHAYFQNEKRKALKCTCRYRCCMQYNSH